MNGSLVITRKKDEWLKIGDAWVQVIACGGGAAKLRIVADRSTRIVRAEISGEHPPGPGLAFQNGFHPLQLARWKASTMGLKNRRKKINQRNKAKDAKRYGKLQKRSGGGGYRR